MTPAGRAVTLRDEGRSRCISAREISEAPRGFSANNETMNDLLLYLGGALTILWGTAHLFPTSKVVQGFGPITQDNRRILTMEWVAEAILLTFTGVLIVVMTARFGTGAPATKTTAAVSAAMLLVLAGVSSLTGGRVDFIMYRLCAPIFVLSAALLLAGAFL